MSPASDGSGRAAAPGVDVAAAAGQRGAALLVQLLTGVHDARRLVAPVVLVVVVDLVCATAACNPSHKPHACSIRLYPSLAALLLSPTLSEDILQSGNAVVRIRLDRTASSSPLDSVYRLLMH